MALPKVTRVSAPCHGLIRSQAPLPLSPGQANMSPDRLALSVLLSEGNDETHS